MIKKCDVLVENFKAGNLNSTVSIIKVYQRKIQNYLLFHNWFGQNGPYAKRGGYDYLVQAMGGIMSITGEKNGNPTKIGVGFLILLLVCMHLMQF